MFNKFDDSNVFWALVGAVISGAAILFIHTFIGLIMVSLFLYYSTLPIYDRLESYIKNRTIRALLSIAIFVVPLLITIVYTSIIVLTDIYNFVREFDSQSFISQSRFEELLGDTTGLLPMDLSGNMSQEEIINSLSGFTIDFISSISTILSIVIYVLMVSIAVFYLLRDGNNLKEWFNNTIGDNNPEVKNFFVEVNKDLQVIYFGNTLTIFIVAAIGSLTFFAYNMLAPPIISMPYPFLFGFVCGILSIVPVLGIKIVYIPTFIYLSSLTVLNGQTELIWIPIVGMFISGVLIDLIPETYIRPYMSNRSMHLGLVIIAYLTGVIIFGWYGLFLGPVILSITYQFLRVGVPYIVNN